MSFCLSKIFQFSHSILTCNVKWVLCHKSCCCIKNEWYVFHVLPETGAMDRQFTMTLCGKSLSPFLASMLSKKKKQRGNGKIFPKMICAAYWISFSLESQLTKNCHENWIYNSTHSFNCILEQIELLFSCIFSPRTLNWNFSSMPRLLSAHQIFGWDLRAFKETAANRNEKSHWVNR